MEIIKRFIVFAILPPLISIGSLFLMTGLVGCRVRTLVYCKVGSELIFILFAFLVLVLMYIAIFSRYKSTSKLAGILYSIAGIGPLFLVFVFSSIGSYIVNSDDGLVVIIIFINGSVAIIVGSILGAVISLILEHNRR